MKHYWSDEVRIMLHPLATYRQLAGQVDKGGFRLLLRRTLFLVLVFGAFVSFTASGRLTVPLLIEGTFFWSFAPVLQILVMAGMVLTFTRGRMPMPMALDLFAMGYGPFLLWMLGIAGTCLFVPLKQIYLWPAVSGWILPISLVGTWLWSNVISFAFLRGALSLTPLRAGACLLLYTVMFWGIILSYLFGVEALQLHRFRF